MITFSSLYMTSKVSIPKIWGKSPEKLWSNVYLTSTFSHFTEIENESTYGIFKTYTFGKAKDPEAAIQRRSDETALPETSKNARENISGRAQEQCPSLTPTEFNF